MTTPRLRPEDRRCASVFPGFHGISWDFAGRQGKGWFWPPHGAPSRHLAMVRLKIPFVGAAATPIEPPKMATPPPFRTTAPQQNASWPVSRVLYGRRFPACVTAIPLKCARYRTPRATYPDDWRGNLPGLSSRAVPIRFCSRWGLPCRSRYRSRGGLLPHPFTLTHPNTNAGRAVCFLWHFPWGRPRRPLAGTVFPWSPDFPPRRPFDPCRSGRPAD